MKSVNVVTWFEIPVTDMSRAKKFYGAVLGVELTDMPPMGDDSEMSAFPWVEGAPNASGALIKSKDSTPSSDGIVIYFHSEDVNSELERVEANGGKVLIPKMAIGEFGFFAQFTDTEGNRVALHSQK